MHNFRRLLWAWLPVLVLMTLIFGASTDLGSSSHSSRLIGPILHFLFPGMSPAAIDQVVLGVRKGAHVSEYGLLCLLIWRARRLTGSPVPVGWSWATASESLWLAVLYAATDELHQTFVPTREGCLRDVFIDSSGAVLGLFLLWRLGRLRRQW